MNDFRFSLRTAVALVTIAALGMAVFSLPSVRQRMAVRAIEHVGGRVVYEEAAYSRAPTGPLVRMVHYFGHDAFYAVRHVDMPNTASEEDFARLDAFPKLRSLSVDGSPSITNEALRHVASLSMLEDSRVCNAPAIDVDGMMCLTHLTGLRSLTLSGTSASDAFIAELSDLPALEELWLGHCPITDRGLAKLRDCRTLRSIGLISVKATDATADVLATLPNLADVCLIGTEITDAWLEKFSGLPKLRKLDVSLTHVAASGAAEFRKRNPRVKLQWE